MIPELRKGDKVCIAVPLCMPSLPTPAGVQMAKDEAAKLAQEWMFLLSALGVKVLRWEANDHIHKFEITMLMRDDSVPSAG